MNGSERKDTCTPILVEPHQHRVPGIGSAEMASEIETRWATRNPSPGKCWSRRRSPSLSVMNSSQAHSVPPTPWPSRTHPPAGGQGRDQLGTSPYPPDLTSTRQGKRSDLPNLMPRVWEGLEGRGGTESGMGCLPRGTTGFDGARRWLRFNEWAFIPTPRSWPPKGGRRTGQ